MEITIHDGSMWTWWIVAAGLLIAELVLPGVFLVWLGIAAAMVGLHSSHASGITGTLIGPNGIDVGWSR
jgi:membrane protein implicated in regulation of membrane protease activity